MTNSEIIKAAMNSGEQFIRLSVASPSGPYRIPAKGCLHPDSVPANLLGIVLVDFFDKNLLELRTRVPILLCGESSQGTPQSTNGSLLNSVLPPATAQPQQAQATTQVSSQVKTQPPQHQAAQQPSPALSPTSPTSPPSSDGSALESVSEAHHPELSRELLMAQATQLRSLTLQAEEAAGSAIDLEKMSVLRDAHYTREVGEAFQLNSAMRREVFATQTAYQEKAFRQLDLVDAAAGRMMRLADEVVRRVKDPMFQPAPPPPPPPPPPPDYAGIAIAMFQALGRVGAAWSPNAKRRPGRRERQAVLKLLEKAQTSSPDGLKAALDEFAKKGGAGATPESVVEPKQQTDNDNKTFAISKKQLLDLVESGAISALSQNGKLAEMIRDDKLDEFMKLLGQAGEP
jgi:hypothetical protein